MTKKILFLYLYILLIVIVGGSIGIARYFFVNYRVSATNKKMVVLQKISSEPSPTTKPTEVPTKPIPETADIAVPYAAQAPFSNWTVHEESCEEAALLMYHEFLLGTAYQNNKIPDAAGDTVMRDMKSWQIKNYGSEADLSIDVLGKFAADYYGLKSTVKNNITELDIKKAISAGSPVLLPVMTHSLQNTMYGPYSVYHILLIKGYDATGVITNDAGVGNGQNHHYDWNILWQAIDAQTAKMNQGRTMLVLTK